MTMTVKELKRAHVLQEVENGRMTGVKAAEVLELSERQVRRLLKTYRMKGAEGLVHGKTDPCHAFRAYPTPFPNPVSSM